MVGWVFKAWTAVDMLIIDCRALAVQVEHSSRGPVLVDVLTVYGAAGKSMIFTQTRREADEVAAAVAKVIPCEVRHPV